MENNNLSNSDLEQNKSSENTKKESAADIILRKYAKKQAETNEVENKQTIKESETVQKVIEKEEKIEEIKMVEKPIEKEEEVVMQEKPEEKNTETVKIEEKEVQKAEEENTVKNTEIEKVVETKKEKVIVTKEEVVDTEQNEGKQQEENSVQEKTVNYAQFTKKQLLEKFDELLLLPFVEMKDSVEKIKSSFYKQHKNEIANAKRKFVKDGNNEADFKPEQDELEGQFKEKYNNFKELKTKHIQAIEEEKKNNLEKKYEIIEKIENLINTTEEISTTFDEFKSLQDQWKDIGLVTQEETKALWEKYNFANEKFYDYIKIRKRKRLYFYCYNSL